MATTQSPVASAQAGHLSRWVKAVRGAVFIGFGAAGTLSLAVVIREYLSPWRALPDDRVVAYVGSSCSGAQALVRAVLARDDLDELVFLAPVSEPRRPADESQTESTFVAAVCDRTLSQLLLRAPWLAVLPRAVACRWLAHDSTAANQRLAQGGLPTYVFGGEQIEWGREAAVFERQGMHFDASTHGVIFVRPLSAAASDEERAVTASRQERKARRVSLLRAGRASAPLVTMEWIAW